MKIIMIFVPLFFMAIGVYAIYLAQYQNGILDLFASILFGVTAFLKLKKHD